jgi:excisionase family DNA binding protein
MPSDLEASADEGLERLWRVEQIADRLEVGRSKVFQLIADGQLRSLKIGGSRRVTETAVRELVARLEEESSQ